MVRSSTTARTDARWSASAPSASSPFAASMHLIAPAFQHAPREPAHGLFVVDQQHQPGATARAAPVAASVTPAVLR